MTENGQVRAGEAPAALQRPLQWLSLLAATIVCVAFVFSVRAVWHPLVLYSAFVFLCFPWMSDRRVSRVVAGATGLAACWFLWRIGDILTPLLVALGLAFLCRPAYLWLRGKTGRWKPLRLGRTAASAVLTILLFGFLGIVGAQTGTLLVGQADEFARLVDSASERIRLIFPESWLDSRLLSGAVDGIVLGVEEIGERLPDYTRALMGSLGYALAGALGVLMTLIFFFYALKDSSEIAAITGRRYLPDSLKNFLDSRSNRIVTTVRSFAQGFFITSLVVFVLTLTLLLVAGVRMAFLLALVAALLNVIPVIGFWVSTAITLVIALATGLEPRTVLLVGLGLGAINVFEGNFLQPRVIGRRVGLHPVAAIMSVAVFGRILGFPGVLLGIPLAAVLTKEWEDFLEKRRNRSREEGA